MNLTSERLELREMTWDHLDFIHQFHSIPEVARFNTIGIPKTKDDTREAMRRAIEDLESEKRSIIGWVVYSKETQQPIGEAGFSLSNNRFHRGEIHYHILPELWSKGLGTEIAKRLIKLGFERFRLHRIEAGVATENTASIKVLEKAGMQREGLRRKVLPIRGEWYDNYMYAILDDDYFERV